MAPYSMPLLSMPYILSWRKWGYYPGGILGVILIIVLILLVLGQL